ncbi:MAG: hypothetical protein FWH27_15945 [Planctomycetaceae bacterium]|nr:hypothetical protein [Planctomycetaceae bacterium]
MSHLLLFYLARCSVFLLAAVLLLELLVRVSRLKSATVHRVLWGTVLLVSLFGFAIPITVPVARQPETPGQSSPGPLAVPASIPQLEPPLPEQHGSVIPPTPAVAVDAVPLPKPQIPEPPAFVTVCTVAQAWVTQHWQGIVLTVWAVGVAVLVAWRLVSHALLTVQLFRQVKPIDGATRESWEMLLTRHGFRRTAVPIRLTESTGPAIIRNGFGFVLLIPETLWSELSPELRDGVLRHELGHLAHRDTLLSPLAYLLATLQWFNPAAWFALKRYNKATEWHADEFAYGPQQDGSSLLAETFLTIHNSTGSRGLSLQSFARFSTLERVNHLITLEQSGKEHAMKKSIIGAVALTLLFAGTFRVEFVAVAETEALEPNVAAESQADLTPPQETVLPQKEKLKEFRIFGRVLMPDGTPVKSANVTGNGFVKTNAAYGFSTTTDQDGKYVFHGPLHMPECDAFSCQAYLSHSPENTIVGELIDRLARRQLREVFEPQVSEIRSFYRSDRDEIECDFILQDGFPIHGTVRYADGSPAKNANVFFVPAKTPEVFKEKMSATFSRGAQTDDEGEYRIYLSPGEYRVFTTRGRNDELAEAGAEKNPQVDLVLKNITLIRFVHADGTPLFREKVLTPLNFSCWDLGELDALGNPTWGSFSHGADVNDNGDLEISPKGKAYIHFTSDDFQEGFVGEIPTGLENFTVYSAQLVPTAKARFRILDASKKPLIGQQVFCHVRVRHTLTRSSTGLRAGDAIRTDEQGYITVSVPALGDLADRFWYELIVSFPSQDVKLRKEPEFRPPLPDTVTDFGDVFLDGDDSEFEPAE